VENTVSSPVEALKTILVMGDSISAGFGIDKSRGWVTLLEERFNADSGANFGGKYQIINASISGETSTGGRHRLSAALVKYQPDLVVIELGGNDGLRGTPIKHIKANIQSMIVQSKQSGAQVMVLGMRIPPNYGERYTQEFAAIYSDLAEEHDLLFVPFLFEGLVGQTDMIQQDGIHPTQKAQPVMMQHVWGVLETQYLSK